MLCFLLPSSQARGLLSDYDFLMSTRQEVVNKYKAPETSAKPLAKSVITIDNYDQRFGSGCREEEEASGKEEKTVLPNSQST